MNRWLRFVVVMALLALSTFSSAFSVESGEKEKPLSQGEKFTLAGELFEREDYAAIIELLRGEVEDTAEPHPYACIVYGAAHMRIDNNPAAIGAFRKGITAAPDHMPLHYNLGVALSQEELYEEAGDTFITVGALDLKNAARHFYTAAQCYYFAEMSDRSLETLKGILDSPGAKAEWFNLAAVNAIRLELWEEAEGFIERVVGLEPDKRMHWKRLAYVRLQRKKERDAAAAMEIAARLPGATEQDRKQLSGMYRRVTAPILGLEVEKLLPNDAEQDDVYIGSLLRASRLEKLTEYIEGIVSGKPAAFLFLIQGAAYYRSGSLPEAQRSFSRGAVLEGEDETERCRMLEGLVAWERRDWASAKVAFRLLADGEGVFCRQAASAIASIESMESIAEELAKTHD